MRSRSCGVIHAPARAPQDVAELLAGEADGRRVDDRQELLEVLGQHAVEERRIPILEGRQADVLLERVVLASQARELELDLFLDAHDPVGKEPMEVERLALIGAEGEVLGEEAIAQQGRPTQGDVGRTAGNDGIKGCWQGSHRVRG